jgi:hypothetical protein
MMTKKDYKKIAETIHTLGVQTRDEAIYRDNLLRALCETFKGINFNKEKFILTATKTKE